MGSLGCGGGERPAPWCPISLLATPSSSGTERADAGHLKPEPFSVFLLEKEAGWCPVPGAVASSLAQHPELAPRTLESAFLEAKEEACSLHLPRPWPAGPELGLCHPAACSCPLASAPS